MWEDAEKTKKHPPLFVGVCDSMKEGRGSRERKKWGNREGCVDMIKLRQGV